MNVYQKPETDIVLCTELDSLLGFVKASSGGRTQVVVDMGNAVDPWSPNAGLSEYNEIWDDEETEDNSPNKLKN
jgi:hypothetical protein